MFKKKPLFGKKRRKNFFESGPWAVDMPTPMVRTQKSFFCFAAGGGFFSGKRNAYMPLIQPKTIGL
jgi:hypothetical protein